MTRIAVALISLFALAIVGASAQRAPEFVRDGSARVLTFPRMEYPPVARSAREQGAVVVRATLSAKGTVSDTVALTGGGLIMEAALVMRKRGRSSPAPRRSFSCISSKSMGPAVGPVRSSAWAMRTTSPESRRVFRMLSGRVAAVPLQRFLEPGGPTTGRYLRSKCPSAASSRFSSTVRTADLPLSATVPEASLSTTTTSSLVPSV